MSPSRTVIVGSALPILLLIGLVGFPPVRVAVGLEEPEPVLFGSTAGRIVPGATPDPGGGVAGSADEAKSVARLRRSITAGRELAFTGTEIVSVWHLGGSTTQVLDLVQGPDGVRTAIARDGETRAGENRTIGLGSTDDALAGLSERTLDALAAGYDLRSGGTDLVAGRATTMVVATRGGREMARMWLDDRTGLLLRQDVRDSAGRLHRTASFVDLTIAGNRVPPVPSRTPATLKAPVQMFGIGRLGVPQQRRSGEVTPTPAPSGPWSDVVDAAELAELRAEGWPCPVALAAGFVLLDARRKSTSDRDTVHLTYGDGLSTISVFLQPGDLDATRLTGLTSRKWGDAEVYVRTGRPEVMVWQGGSTVITAVGDAEPADLRSVLSVLPRQPNHGTLGSLQQRMGSALTWLTG